MNIADVLSSARATAEGIQWLLVSATSQEVLADQLRAILPAGAVVGQFRPTEVRFKPGRKITAHYDTFVDTESPKGHYVRPIAVTWEPNASADQPEETSPLVKMQAEAVHRGVAFPFQRLWKDFRDWTMHVSVSPLDARFNQLVRLSDQQHVHAMLAQTRLGESDRPPSKEYSVTPLKYRPGKGHVLRYDPLDAGAETVFAKLYVAEDRARVFRREDAARCFRVASTAAEWLEEQGGPAHCLRPLACVAADAVVLYPRAAGTPLCDFARRPVGDVATCLQRTGAALRTLHQMPVEAIGSLGPPHDFAAETRLIAKKGVHIPVILPQVGSAIEALLERARELHEQLPQEPPTFTHGDFKSEHIWVAPDRLTMMDFDTVRLADPALDVGCFLADWQFWNVVSHQAGLEKPENFLAGYASGVPKERLMRARLYEATGLIKCAVRRVQLFEHDWASRVAGLVERSQVALNDLQLSLGMPAKRRSLMEVHEHETQRSLFSHPPSAGPVNSSCGSAVIDPGISTLATVLNGEELVKHLGALACSQRWGTPRASEFRVLKWHRADRCTFRVAFQTELVGKQTELVGKVYAIDRHDVHEVMEKISRSGFDQAAQYSIPQPVAYLPAVRLLLQEWVEGTSANEVFKQGDGPQSTEAAKRCARWLARFHALAPPVGPIAEVEKLLRQGERKCQLIAQADASLGGRCADLSERLRASAPAPESFPLCASQGDFWERQIIFANGRTVVLDWDDYDVADPARDVAHFIVSLEKLAGKHLASTRALDEAGGVFLRTYLEEGGETRVPERLSFYKAAFWLRWWKNAIQTRAPGWRKLVEMMLDESFTSLARLGRS